MIIFWFEPTNNKRNLYSCIMKRWVFIKQDLINSICDTIHLDKSASFSPLHFNTYWYDSWNCLRVLFIFYLFLFSSTECRKRIQIDLRKFIYKTFRDDYVVGWLACTRKLPGSRRATKIIALNRNGRPHNFRRVLISSREALASTINNLRPILAVQVQIIWNNITMFRPATGARPMSVQ